MTLPRKQTKIWTTKEGTKLRICDMSDDHLLNSIRILQRTAEAKRICNSVFYSLDPGPSGDMAQICFEQEQRQALDATWEEYVPEIFYNLWKEAERRELSLPQQDTRVDIETNLLCKYLEKELK